MKALFAALIAFATLVVAGCGLGSDEKSGASGGESAASIVPASAALHVSVSSDLDSEQWAKLEAVLEKFPGRSSLLEEIRSELGEEDLDYERDVAPALGDEVDLVLLDFKGGGENLIVLTKPDNEERLDELLAKTDVKPAKADIEGFTAIADESGALESLRRAGGEESLAESDDFQAAMADLPDEAVAKIYVNGESAERALEEELQDVSPALARQGLRWAGAAVEALDNGVRIEGTVSAENENTKIENYTPALLDSIPAGALAVVSFRGGSDQLNEQLEANPGLQNQLSQLQAALGVSFQELTAFFHGESALYVREDSPFPEVTLALEAADEADAVRTLDRLAERAGGLFGSRPTKTMVSGIQVTTMGFGRFAVSYAAFDGTLLLTTAVSGITDFRDEGKKLTDDAAYTGAREAAEVPGEIAGLLYVNIRESVELAAKFAQVAGEDVPPVLDANLRPLESFLMYAEQDGDESHFSGFLEIE